MIEHILGRLDKVENSQGLTLEKMNQTTECEALEIMGR